MVSRFCFGGNVPYSYTEVHVLQDYNMENEVLNILPTVADGEFYSPCGEWYCFAVVFADASVIATQFYCPSDSYKSRR